MIFYKISGVLPAPWEDFFYQGDSDGTSINRPNITINSEKEENEFRTSSKPPIEPISLDSQEFVILPSDSTDGWRDAVIPGEQVTLEIAKKILASANQCQPNDIEIDQAGVAISI